MTKHPTHAYYLIADPFTRCVVCRARNRGLIVTTERHLVILPVDKPTWESFRVGDTVDVGRLPSNAYHMWNRAVVAAGRTKAMRGGGR